LAPSVVVLRRTRVREIAVAALPAGKVAPQVLLAVSAVLVAVGAAAARAAADNAAAVVVAEVAAAAKARSAIT
jgi:hypothetical protein